MADPGDGWSVERLGTHHDRSAFDCGRPMLTDWLKQRAGQFEKRDLARTYVAARAGEAVVLGYYALSSHRVAFEALPADQARGLPRLDVPVVLLGRLAVDLTAQGRGLGSLLLIDALRRAQHLAEHVGVRAVEVDAIDDDARAFYKKFGVTPLLDDPNHLFLPMQVVRKLGLPPLGG
ncbi:GNAT family N-acetyltransferase [Paludisphaera mucosa]|uniref:GNAT family N-acetyltransferase n=1 Tax=Paludisphaera mucosa TaxID=3030827 RepID=A0ABT6FBE7_9BACT|nr:GNAT family N-acetyltransferase [Paludisphaera mucosa]MDG3004906.1 GNAT family N-acetyltransferase [Paludisphaera mucosa]